MFLFQSTSTSQERQHATDAECQTDAPTVASHETQLSYMTLGPRLQSKGNRSNYSYKTLWGLCVPNMCSIMPG